MKSRIGTKHTWGLLVNGGGGSDLIGTMSNEGLSIKHAVHEKGENGSVQTFGYGLANLEDNSRWWLVSSS